MSFRWCQRLVLALGMLSALATGTTGCMGERPAINRVQPDRLDKTQLIPVQYAALTAEGARPETLTADQIRREPVWLHQVTIIDKPATTGFQGISWYTSVERINWEVTEHFLIARQAYDRLHNGQGSQAGSSLDPISNNPRQGEILAVYAIDKHFDIRRSYNAGTGEELNVIEENASDRPWYQRQFMRVDWSRNLVSGFSAMEYVEWQGKVRAEPVPMYINDPTDPNRPVFNYDTFNGQENTLTYFDVTSRAILHPEEINLGYAGYPNLPVCALTTHSTESCQPADVLLRQSFMRLDVNRDYEPQALDGHRMERFGFFETSRIGYNTDRSDIINTDRRHWSNRHNLWMQHHARPEDRAVGRAPAGTLHHLPNNGDVTCQQDSDCQGVSATASCDTATHTCGERYIRCTEDRDCADVGFGSTCDTNIAWTRPDRAGLCLLPYRQRVVRPLAYHLSENYPERMMPVTREVARQWNLAFTRAVQSARHRECLLDDAVTDKASCEAWRNEANPRKVNDQDDPAHVWVACHNPVWGTDPNLPGYRPEAEVNAAYQAGWDLPACGPQGTVARLGDMRYSMIGSVNELDRQGPWGLAMITGDPETGEVYAGRGAVWQTVTDLQAAWATDVIRLLNGDLSPEQVANGENIIDAYREVADRLGGRDARDGRGARNNGAPNVPFQPRAVHRDIHSHDELQGILNATTFSHLNVARPSSGSASGLDLSALPGGGRVQINDLARGQDGRLSERNFIANASRTVPAGLMSPPGAHGTGVRFARLRGTDIENRLLDQHLLAAAGSAGRELGMTPEVVEAVSPARRNNNQFRALENRIRSLHSAFQCNYEAQFEDDVVYTQLHRFLQNEVPEDVRFGQTWNFKNSDGSLNYDVIQRYLEQFIHYGVLAHELGHSVGQRHNFAASADAVNYRDEYWQLRSRRHNGNVMAIRPRWEYLANNQDFYSQEELEGGIEEYAYSSVMDYKGFNEDAHGLGRYDFAFVKHGYVNMVEAFRTVANPTDARHMFAGISGGGQRAIEFGLVGSGSSPRLTSFHYTDLPRLVGTTMSQAPDGMAVEVPNVGTANRYDVFLDETRSEAYNSFSWQPDHTNVAFRGPQGEDGSFLVVPYRFATDDYAGVYWFDQRYDNGADMYESMRYVSQRYLDYYFANAFARERSSFTVDGYNARMRGRFLDNLYYVMRVASIYHVFYNDIFANITNYNEWLNQTSSISQRLGVSTVMDTFANAITMPEWSIYGAQYTLRNRLDGSRVYEIANLGDSVALQLEIGDGRMFETRYDWGSGSFWRDRLINAGSYYDKLDGLNYLTDTFLFAPERGLNQDLRNYQVNVYTVYPAQTIRFFGSILSQDHADVAPQVRGPRTANQQVLRPQLALMNLPTGTGPGKNGRDPALNAIDPNLGFTGELWTAVYAMANLSQGFDQRFMHYARLWVDGDPNAVAERSDLQLVDFVDPFSQLRYRAVHYGQEPGNPQLDPGASPRELARAGVTPADAERGIAARMLLHANDLKRAWETAGTPELRARAEAELKQYIDLVNIVRHLNRQYAQGGQVVGPSSGSTGE